VDRHLTPVVEVHHDHLEHVAGAVGSENEGPYGRVVVAHVGDHEGMSNRVENVVSTDSVVAR
jgi:hypothetical protein